MFTDIRRHNQQWSRDRWRASQWFPRQRIAENMCRLLEIENERHQAIIDTELKRTLDAISLTKQELEAEIRVDKELTQHHLSETLSEDDVNKQRRQDQMVSPVFLNSAFIRDVAKPQVGGAQKGRIALTNKNKYPLRRWVSITSERDGFARDTLARRQFEQAKLARMPVLEEYEMKPLE